MGESETIKKFEHPITFEEAAKHITNPDYGLGISWLWQLSALHPFTVAAKIHDLRYDFLEPGDSTNSVDKEFYNNCGEVLTKSSPTILVIERELFFKLCVARGEFFSRGTVKCEYRNYHNYSPCSYGQIGRIYNYRCVTCGLHTNFKGKV